MSFSASLEQIIATNRNGLLGIAPGWHRVRLGDVAKVLNGFPFPSAQFSKSGGTPLIRIRDVLVGSTETYFKGAYEEEYVVQHGDLLVGMDGDFNAARWAGGTALLNQRVCKLMPNPDALDIQFLTYLLPGYLAAVHEETSSITVKHLSSKTVLDLAIPLPPMPVQRRVVAEIDKQFTRLDAGVEALKRLEAHLRRYRAAVLAAAAAGALESGQAGGQQGCGHEWPTVELGSVLKSIKAGKSFRCEERPPRGTEVGVVKVSAVTWGTFDEDESKTTLDDSRYDPSLLINEGDFLFSRANTIDLVGTCVIVHRITKKLMLSDKILRFEFEGADPRWVLWMLRSPVGRREIERLATGNQDSMRNIGQDRIRQVRLPMPSLVTQMRFAKHIEEQLEAARRTEESARQSLTRAARLRTAILSRAFADQLGEVDARLDGGQR